MSTELARVTTSEIQLMAKEAAASGMFGMTPSQAFVLMLVCQAKGEHPIEAVLRYDVIQGKPAKKASAVLADFQAAGGRCKWLVISPTRAVAEFSHPQLYPEPLEVEYTMEMAAKAGLANKKNYKETPEDMMVARTITRGIRRVMPGIVVGLYSPEELEEEAIIDVTPKASNGLPTSRSEANAAFAPANGNGHEETAEDQRNWTTYMAEIVRKANERWAAECKSSGVTVNSNLLTLLNRYQLNAAMGSAAIAAGKAEKPEKQTAGWASDTCERLYQSDRDWIRDGVRQYHARKLDEARRAAGLPSAESAEPEPAMAGAAAQGPSEGFEAGDANEDLPRGDE